MALIRGRPAPQHMSELAHDPVRLKLRDTPQLQACYLTPTGSDSRCLEPMQTPRLEPSRISQTVSGQLENSPSAKSASIYAKQSLVGSPVVRTVTNQSQRGFFSAQHRSVSPVPQREQSQSNPSLGKGAQVLGRMAGSMQVPMQPNTALPPQRHTQATTFRGAPQTSGSSPVSRTRSPPSDAHATYANVSLGAAKPLPKVTKTDGRFSARSSFTIPRKELVNNRQSSSRRSLKNLQKDTSNSGVCKFNGKTGNRFVAPHHAACRIQRAWRMSCWRRRFTQFSRRELGWLGSLEWLQRHNLLYGTELADADDVSWWMQMREGAPLDREVDPWGCAKLHEHLQRVWYGKSPEDIAAEEAQKLQALVSQSQTVESDNTNEYREVCAQNGTAEPKLGHAQHVGTDAHHRSYSQMPNQHQVLRSPVSQEKSLEVPNVSTAAAVGGAMCSSRGSFANVMKAASPMRMTTSLSPRRAATQLQSPEGDMTSRVAQTSARQHSMCQSSPPQTHRAPRLSHAALAAMLTGINTSMPSSSLATSARADNSVAASIRARSPITAQRVQGSMSQPGLLNLSGGQQQAVGPVSRQPFPSRSCHLSTSPPPLVSRVGATGLHGVR